MKPNAIKAQFTKHIKDSMGSVNPRINHWYAGITNNTDRRKAEHILEKEIIKHWKFIDAGSVDNANEVEKYFSEKGTRNLPFKNGGKKNSKYAYIFKLPVSKSNGLNGASDVFEILKSVFGD